jgi:putative pyruvate formate lyase activating enzyme
MHQAREIYTPAEKELLSSCTLCPRECKVNRFVSPTGTCGTSAAFEIASICIHRGEEPGISGKKGICNIFFTGCNMKCLYCQNYQISCLLPSSPRKYVSLDDVLDKVENILDQGINAVGFVSPSHVVPQAMAILRGLYSRRRTPVIVWNTNAYEKADVIRELEGKVDVYLPDFKYVSPELSLHYSGVHDYPTVALSALREMYRQKGSTLQKSDDGQAESGLVIRHLVLPGHAEESVRLLELVASEISAGVHISLMSQYYPTCRVKDHPLLRRSLYPEEYQVVVDAFHGLGFRNGWFQEMDSTHSYQPDFDKDHPFER